MFQVVVHLVPTCVTARRHGGWKRGAQLWSGREERREQEAASPTGTGAQSCGFFLSFLPSWPSTFYITTTLRAVETDSPAKVLWDRRTCTRWKITSSPPGFLSSRPSAAIARILYGELFFFLKEKTKVFQRLSWRASSKSKTGFLLQGVWKTRISMPR